MSQYFLKSMVMACLTTGNMQCQIFSDEVKKTVLFSEFLFDASGITYFTEIKDSFEKKIQTKRIRDFKP